MDAVLRAAVIYLFLVVLFRLAGKRTLVEVTTFDLVLLLIISEATQQGLLGEDFSVTNAIIVVTTLVGLEMGLSFLKRRYAILDHIIEGTPLILVQDGQPIEERMRKARVEPEDVLVQARISQAVESMDQIKYAVLERDGQISIIPKSS